VDRVEPLLLETWRRARRAIPHAGAERAPRRGGSPGPEPCGAPRIGEPAPQCERTAAAVERGQHVLLRSDRDRGVVRLRGHREARKDGGREAPVQLVCIEEWKGAASRGSAPPPDRRLPVDIARRRSRETVSGTQMMIEERQWPIGGERAQPEREARELHRGWIEVDAVEAALRDSAAEGGAVRRTDVARRHGSFADERLFVGVREIAARGHEKRAASHRGIEHAQREHVTRRAVAHERRERAPHEVLRHRARRVEGTGRLAAPRPREDERVAPALGREIQDTLVHGPKLFDAKIRVRDAFAAIPGGPRGDCDEHVTDDAIVERESLGQRRRRGREETAVEWGHAQRTRPAPAMREARDRLQRLPEAATRFVFRLTSLRQGYGGPPKRFARRRKAEATRGAAACCTAWGPL